ncbi:MAG: hypothetical protein ABF489_06240, partial [Bifidobacterium sp.]|uniref:hypothetical protein n=1 Tax=Bifidobacterium sp. TaxID=41200 RepID=UPI0039E88BCB
MNDFQRPDTYTRMNAKVRAIWLRADTLESRVPRSGAMLVLKFPRYDLDMSTNSTYIYVRGNHGFAHASTGI